MIYEVQFTNGQFKTIEANRFYIGVNTIVFMMFEKDVLCYALVDILFISEKEGT
jgi:hypothetical protein